MRRVRIILGTALLVACSLMVSAAERGPEVKRAQVRELLRESPADASPADAAPSADEEILGAIAGAAAACNPIGAFTDQFAGTNRFRGNVYSITKQIDLIEIKMELGFRTTAGNPMPLFFYVFEQSLDDPPTFDVLFETSINASGNNGQPTLYSSGVINAGGGPVTLEAGKRYAIGTAWTSASGVPSTVTFGADGLVYPRPFSAGQVDGLVSVNQAPPLTTLGTPVVFTASGAYSMELCLSGACCVSVPVTVCEDLSQTACFNGGGTFTAAGVTCAEDLGNVCPPASGACCLGEDACLDQNQYACEAGGGVWNDGVPCGDASEPCAPRGACCRSDQSPPCTPNVTETRCGLLGGVYRGDGVDCDVSPGCGAGACCVGEACSVMTPTECSAQLPGAVFSGPGTSCDTNPCIPTGACCSGSTCTDVTEEACALIFGSHFRGDGTRCDSLATPCGRGACCRPGLGCEDGANGENIGLTQADCETFGGVFRGDGTTCTTISLRCEGVCCSSPLDQPGAPQTVCTEQTTPSSCSDKLGGTFASYTDDCTTACPVTSPSACCLSDDECIEATQNTCETELRGRFVGTCRFGGGVCNSSADCLICEGGGEPAGTACSATNPCTAGGTCTRTTACLSNASCSTNLCASTAPVGACCDGTNCTNGVTEQACLSISGAVYRGDGSTCSGLSPACGPLGACCDSVSCTDGDVASACGLTFVEGALCTDVPAPCAETGSCCNDVTFECIDDVVVEACNGTNLNHVISGTCSLDCVAPQGACCNGSTCTGTSKFECQLSGGRFKAAATCASVTCGACCNLDGVCTDDAIASECTAPDEVFHPGFLCADVCFARGACCRGETCIDGLTQLGCEGGTGTDGVYGGDGSVCTADTCTTGACCGTNEACTELSRKECDLDGGDYLGAGSTCSIVTAEVCQRGVCCASDGTCTSNSIILDCADPLDFLPDTTDCAAADCLGRGACCQSDGSCSVRRQLPCLAAGGTYHGDTTDCSTSPCALGACCDGSSACTPATLRDCTNSGGTFLGAGSPCLPGVDTCTVPRGACCRAGACTIETDEPGTGCAATGGVYGGDNTTCDAADQCDVGACCDADVCTDTGTRQDCELAGGTYGGSGTVCTGVGECDLGACCEPSGTCTDEALRLTCSFQFGSFTFGTPCSGVTCEARGACCAVGACSPNVTRADCETFGDHYLGNGSDCTGVDCTSGACCNAGGCTPAADAAVNCTDLGGNYLGEGTVCTGVNCDQGACCDPLEFCTNEARAACTAPGGQFFGGVMCDSRVCDITILRSRPSEGTIDARQPYLPDGSASTGFQRVDINFTGNPSQLVPGDFVVELVPAGGSSPAVTAVTASGTNVAVELDGPIPMNHWTGIRHVSSDTVTWLGNLPGDVNTDRGVNSLDIAAIVSCIEQQGSCDLSRCDMDRSNACTPADVLRLIDMLSGIGAYAGLGAGSLPAQP